jgi:fumarate reductase flavoprotein subunit
VHLDLRHLGQKKIDAKIPFVRELCVKYQGLDPVKDLIPVRPVVHYMMGGVHTDINGATPLPGLYAAGETACVSINGANRLGSNSLTECLVFGARAGRAAAEYASREMEINPRIIAQKTDEHRRLDHELLEGKGRERIADIRDEMQKVMEESAGIYRGGPSLDAGVATMRRLQERAAQLALDDKSRTFNTERIAALELFNMLDVAEAIVNSAAWRTESRGAHQRTDFPKRDDERFLAHTLISRNADGSCRVDYLPVTITRWPPAERVYGEQKSGSPSSAQTKGEAAPHGGPNQVTGGTIPSGAGV